MRREWTFGGVPLLVVVVLSAWSVDAAEQSSLDPAGPVLPLVPVDVEEDDQLASADEIDPTLSGDLPGEPPLTAALSDPGLEKQVSPADGRRFSIPEPATLAMAALCASGLLIMALRRRWG